MDYDYNQPSFRTPRPRLLARTGDPAPGDPDQGFDARRFGRSRTRLAAIHARFEGPVPADLLRLRLGISAALGRVAHVHFPAKPGDHQHRGDGDSFCGVCDDGDVAVADVCTNR